MKNTLIIHPKDFSTRFLKQIYQPIKNKTVINGGVTKDKVRNMIIDFDTILLCGHGSPNGLFAVGQFGADSNGYIIDESMVESLKGKKLITIWCHANQFVTKYGLKAFSSSMFCSEYSECYYEGIKYVEPGMVEESNDTFASIMSKYINEDVNIIHKKVTQEYGVLGEVNPVAKYNNDRLYYRESDEWDKFQQLLNFIPL